jgi:hypothetical protein
VNVSAGCRSRAAAIELDGAHDLASRCWDLNDPTRAADLAGILADGQDRLVIHPEAVNRYTY